MALRSYATLVLAAVFAFGCGHKPPPPVEEPEAPPPPPRKVAPPPPPKCEALDEACKADASTRARIARTLLAFAPVPGWVYAQGETATVAQGAAETGPAIAMTGYDADKDPKKEIAAREAAYDELAKQVGLTVPKTKPSWKKATCQCSGNQCSGIGGELCKQMKPVSELKAGVWQLDGGVRGGKKGPLLVVQAPVGEGKAMIGIGFVPDDDASGADAAILKAIESIGPTDAADKPPAKDANPK